MKDTDNKLREILQSYGLKVTANRLKVLEMMVVSPVALSHHDITVRLKDHDIDKVTLYRTLNAFARCGLAHKVANEERNWLYALHMHDHDQVAESDDHAHFICSSCDKIYCLPISFDNKKPSVSGVHGFVITSHEYRLHGYCPECT